MPSFNGLSSRYSQVANDDLEIEGIGEKRFQPKPPRCGSWFLTALIFTLAASLFAAAIFMFYDNGSSLQFAPKFPITTTVFQEDPLFTRESSPETDAAWDALLPEGRGFVLVEHPEKYHLGPGIASATGPDRYAISMFHQLHCLGMVREAYYSLTQGRLAHIYTEENLTETQTAHSRTQHVGHCFDYLRQAIMCAGDMTLESAEVSSSGKIRDSVDGWGIAHECKSWDKAVEWTLQHKAPSKHVGIA